MSYTAIPLAKALAKTQGLSPLRLKLLLDEHGLASDPEQLLPVDVLLHLWTAELLARTFLSETQQQLVLQRLRPLWQDWAAAICCPPGAEQQPDIYQLLFSDGRFLAYTSARNYVNLADGEVYHGITPPIETISYNLTTMFQRRYRELG